MFRTLLAVCISLALAVSLAGAANAPSSPAKLSAAEIVDRNVAARGGLQAWRAVQALSLTGKMDAGGNERTTLPVAGYPGGRRTSGAASMPPLRPAEQAQLPFTLELKRSRKMRLELQFKGQTALQVYDGIQGWKVRPFLNRHEVEPFTPDELKIAATQPDLDGPLIDYAAKGSKVELEGMEAVEGRNTYKLKVTGKNGSARHVWVDAESFLETKMEGSPRRLDGKYHPVATYLRDYRQVSGLMIPQVLETIVEAAGPGAQSEKIQFENVVVNPKLDDSQFAKPR